MVQRRSPIRQSSALQEALAWLGAPPADDGQDDLAPLRRHLGDVAASSVPIRQYPNILALFQTRAVLVSTSVKPMLLDASLPLPKQLRSVAQGLMDVHGELAAGYLRTLRTSGPEQLRSLDPAPAALCEMGLANLAQAYEIALLVSAAAPPRLWATALALRQLAQRHAGDGVTGAAETHLKVMLALAAAQPEGFSPREIGFLAAYLRTHGNALELSSAAPVHVDADFWLDATDESAPTASVRRPAPPTAVTHFSCTALSHGAYRHLSQLDQGAGPEDLDLPQAAAQADYRDTLERAATHWATPGKRETHRRRHGYRVQICTHVGALWRQLSAAAADAGEPEAELPASDWMILNEGPGGYAIMHVSGITSGLVAGSAVGLRTTAEMPWHICIVRWARSDNPEHLELGLELLAAQAAAVRVVQRNTGAAAAALPALLLPPLPALQRGEALLTTRGGIAPGPFALIDETDGHIRIAECATAHATLHTGSVEVFEFARQPG